MKVPTLEDRKNRDKHFAATLEILKGDAKKETDRQYVSVERKKVLNFLIDRNLYCGGLQYWNPSEEARREIRDKLGEDEIIESNFYFNMRCGEVLEILKRDAKKQLNSTEHIHPDLKAFNKFLLEQDNFTGDLSPWCPSSKAIEELRENRLIEEKYYVEGYFSPLQKWILQNIEERIRRGELSPLIDLIQEELTPYIENFFPDLTKNDFVFCRLGDVWFIRYKEERAILKANDRLKYIVHLLHYPYRQLDVIELMAFSQKISLDDWFLENTQIYDVDGKDFSREGDISGELNDEDDWASYDNIDHDEKIEKPLRPKTYLPRQEYVSEEFTKEDSEQYENILRTLYKQYQEANSADKKKLKADYEKTKKYISNEMGFLISETANGLVLRKRDRVPENKDKVRANVNQSIKSAMTDIAEVMPSLGKHLHTYLTNRYHCIYAPLDDQPDWHITMKL